MVKKNSETEIISAYVNETENVSFNEFDNDVECCAVTSERKSVKSYVNNDNTGVGVRYRDNLGYLKIALDTLPTKGLFYPDGTTISVRAARGEEIKHWSTMNDQDIEQIHLVDDILTYMLERCCVVRIPNVNGNAWKDLKQLDKIYLVLAIRDFTFIDGENELKVPYGEGKDIPVTKEMIDFLNIPDEIMDFYDSNERCFVFKIDEQQVIRMHIPSIGVTQWIKNYVQAKQTARDIFDEDFVRYAPMLIQDYKKLNVKSYENLVNSTRFWGQKEWSVVSYVARELENASTPKINYTDENGTEVEIPFNFRGGIKGLFLISNPLLGLR